MKSMYAFLPNLIVALLMVLIATFTTGGTAQIFYIWAVINFFIALCFAIAEAGRR